MASVRSAPIHPSRTTGCFRRIKSHEPGQRVMTEAIAFLFGYYGADTTPPTPEEFFSYARHLSTQTYHVCVPCIRRKVSNRLLGGGSPPYCGLVQFLDSIEPVLGTRNLASSLIQAQNIGLQALILYNAFVEIDSDMFLKTHIAEPFLWFSSLLFYETLNYREHGLGAALHYLQDGVVYLEKHAGKKRLSCYFEAYAKYAERSIPLNITFMKYLLSQFV